MNKDEVIKLRDTLKAGKNLPLRIYLNNSHRTIDESSVLQFTKWDDTNGYLYVYSLTDMQSMKMPSNKAGELSLFGTAYEFIEAMEACAFPLSMLETSIDSINSSGGDTINDTYKEAIIYMFTKALHPDLVNMSNTDINVAMGLRDGKKALNDDDDYYEGKFTEPFKETRYVAGRNTYVDSLND